MEYGLELEMPHKTILLVEDNPDDEELTLRALKKNNIRNEDVVVVRDGVEALDYLFGTGKYDGRDTSKQPRVILLDLQLPKLNGHEVLQRLRSDPRTKLQPVVVLTTSSEERDILNSYENGANSYIRKPVDFNTFIDSVKQIGRYWLTLNEPIIRH